MRWFKSKNSSFAGSFFYSTKKNNEFGMPASMVGSALINAVKVSAIPLPASMAMSAALNITRAVNMPMTASMAGSSLVTASSFSGLLDQYPGAAAAYSVRLLSSTYSGALVRIRRANDNNEEDFYPDSNNELSLNSQTSGGTSLSSWISSENGFITTWYDQSGNGNNATTSTAADQPQIINAGALITQGNKPALLGDANCELLFSSTITHSQISEIEVSNITATNQISCSDPSSNWIYFYNSPIAIRVRFSGDDKTFTVSSSTGDQIKSLNYTSGSNSELFLDNVSQGTNTQTGNANYSKLFSFLDSGSFSMNGSYMQEKLIWGTNQGATLSDIVTAVNEYYLKY